MYAKIIVDLASQNTNELFTYRIPDELHDCIYRGSRVYVEFGFQKVLGYVIEIVNQVDYEGNIKDILEVIDFEWGLNNEQIELAKFISEETKAFYTSALELMYPSFMRSRIKKSINVLNFQGLDAELAMLFEMKRRVTITNLILSKYQKIKKEIEKGNLEIVSNIYTYGSQKRVKYYYLKNNNIDVPSEKQRRVLTFLKNYGEATEEEIKENTGCSDYIIDKLYSLKYIDFVEKIPKAEISEEKFVKPINYDFNEKILKDKYQRLSGKPFLLFSNDQEFKLNFYLDLANEVVKDNRQVLVVTPTVLVNTQIAAFFERNMRGYRIYNFSSRTTNSEYYYNFYNVNIQNVDIVISTKANIFLPLENIGLIILIDEENSNYINEQNPRFSVLEVLKYRSNYHQAKLLLSSSTPSIDAYYNYSIAKYFLLKHIINYPNHISLVNMREEYEDLLISQLLRDNLKMQLSRDNVSMLILNNLSYNTSILCKECGKVIKCPKCKIGLSYHKEKDLYRCSYCNLQTKDIVCECGSTDVNHFGFGLERLKERLYQLFPKVRIVQVDSESMNQKSAYDDFLVGLEEKEIDIIIGTNILANFYHPTIKLIGIINADYILNINDYRSSELAYTTISKVNNYQDCQVVIQGFNLDHYSIKDAMNNDYESFYNQEIILRKELNYAPFMETSRLLVVGDYRDIYYYANYFKKVFSRITKGEVIGPVYINRIRGIQLIIKFEDYLKLSTLIDEVNKKFKDKRLIVNFERYPKSFN